MTTNIKEKWTVIFSDYDRYDHSNAEQRKVEVDASSAVEALVLCAVSEWDLGFCAQSYDEVIVVRSVDAHVPSADEWLAVRSAVEARDKEMARAAETAKAENARARDITTLLELATKYPGAARSIVTSVDTIKDSP